MNVKPVVCPIQPRQLQLIRNQDEEEHWISEEELQTEGSSDEEHSGRKKHRSDRTKSKTPLPMSLKHKSNPSTSHSDESPVAKSEDASRVEPDNRPIVWRPKRGSIQLPQMESGEVI